METDTKTLSELVERDGITARSTFQGKTKPPHWGDSQANHYIVTLKHDGRVLITDYYMGLGLIGAPTEKDVLGSLVMDAQGLNIDGEHVYPFEDWASDYGYDTDSRKAEASYRAVVESAKRLRSFLGDKFSEYMTCEVDD